MASKIEWTPEQCVAYVLGRSRDDVLRELTRDPHAFQSKPKPDFIEYLQVKTGFPLSGSIRAYAELLNSMAREIDQAFTQGGPSERGPGYDRASSQELEAFSALQTQLRRPVNLCLILGIGMWRICGTPSKFCWDEDPEITIRKLYDTARLLDIPEAWLWGLRDWLSERRRLRRGIIKRGDVPGWEDWIKEFGNRLEAIIDRRQKREARVAIRDPKERSKLLRLKKGRDKDDRYLGESDPVLHLFVELDRLLKIEDNPPITLLGPTGSGKSFLAEIIHEATAGEGKPFRRYNAADLSGADHNIVRGELYGYGPGHGIAGVPRSGRPGVVEQCKGGTLFIDEITDLPVVGQTSLLTILDGKPVPKFGGAEDLQPPHPRLVFATNKDPDQEIAEGRLRADFWRRLRRFVLSIPPLRERLDDVVLFIKKQQTTPIDLRALHAILQYEWPGNVGELMDVLKVAMRSGRLSYEDLPDDLKDPGLAASEDDAEREALAFAVTLLKQRGIEKGKKGGGLNIKVAQMLGRSPGWASGKLREYGLS